MALLSFRGISTPSLPAQGEQRRSSIFNIPRDIPPGQFSMETPGQISAEIDSQDHVCRPIALGDAERRLEVGRPFGFQLLRRFAEGQRLGLGE